MKLDPLCRMELRYTGDFHLARPYGNEAGTGWGIGDGRIIGDRLAGLTQWSNQTGPAGETGPCFPTPVESSQRPTVPRFSST